MSAAVVLDTCALIWLTLAPEELSGAAHREISAANKILVSSISIWEIGLKAQRGKIDLGVTIEEYTDRVVLSADLELVPVDHFLWLKSLELRWEHRDPADRVIVAMAQELGVKLVTEDVRIKAFYPKSV